MHSLIAVQKTTKLHHCWFWQIKNNPKNKCHGFAVLKAFQIASKENDSTHNLMLLDNCRQIISKHAGLWTVIINNSSAPELNDWNCQYFDHTGFTTRACRYLNRGFLICRFVEAVEALKHYKTVTLTHLGDGIKTQTLKNIHRTKGTLRTALSPPLLNSTSQKEGTEGINKPWLHYYFIFKPQRAARRC